MDARSSNCRNGNRDVSLTVKAASKPHVGIIIVDDDDVRVKVPACSKELDGNLSAQWALGRRYFCVALYVKRRITVESQVAYGYEMISFKVRRNLHGESE